MKVLIDCDPGVDDSIALMLALASSELEVLAVTVVAGNVPVETAFENARRIVAVAGRADLPVYRGCAAPLLGPMIRGRYSGVTGLGGTQLPESPAPMCTEHAVDVLTAHLTRAAAANAPLTVCTLGPMTNLAVALARDATLAKGIARVVAMAGGFATGDNRTAAAEFNVLADAHAAEIVLRCGAPVVLAPLDLTYQALATPALVQDLRARGGRLMGLAADLISFYDRNDPLRYGAPGGPLHDPTVIAYLLRPELFGGRAAHVTVELQGAASFGQTVGHFFGTNGQPTNATVLNRLDAPGFFALLWERLAASLCAS